MQATTKNSSIVLLNDNFNKIYKHFGMSNITEHLQFIPLSHITVYSLRLFIVDQIALKKLFSLTLYDK